VAVVKTLEHDPNFVTDLKRMSPDSLLIGRIALSQVDPDQLEPLAEARRFVEQLLPLATEPRRRAAFDGWEAFNEPFATTADQMARLADFEAERTRLLGREGVRSVVGNFSTGQPSLELWPHFRPALEAVAAHGGYLGLHEYSAPVLWFGFGPHQLNPDSDEGDEGWLTVRYRKVYRQYLIPMGLAVPLVITECGIDGTVQGRPGPPGKGWRDFVGYWATLGMGDDGPGNYVEQLAWYDSQLTQDDYVIGAAIFAAAASPAWESYEILNGVAPILRQYLSVHPVS